MFKSVRYDLLADVALLVVHGAVAGFFILRALEPNRLLPRRLASLGVALLPTGWLVVAAWQLGVFRPNPSVFIRWFGVCLGVYLLSRVHATQRLKE